MLILICFEQTSLLGATFATQPGFNLPTDVNGILDVKVHCTKIVCQMMNMKIE